MPAVPPSWALCPCSGWAGKQQRTHQETWDPGNKRTWRCVGHSPSSSSSLHLPSLPWACPSGWIPQLSRFSSLESQPGVGAAGSVQLLERRPRGAEAVSHQRRMDTGRCCSFVCGIEAAPRVARRLPGVFPWWGSL